MPLIYSTSDREFAERAVENLVSYGIPAYLTPQSRYSNYLVGVTGQYYVHIEADNDRPRANEILAQMGAAQDKPLHLPAGPWVKWSMFVLGIGLAIVILFLLN